MREEPGDVDAKVEIKGFLLRYLDRILQEYRNPGSLKFRNKMIRCTFQLDHSRTWGRRRVVGRNKTLLCFNMTLESL